MFGVLAEKNFTWEGQVSMRSGKGCLSDKGKIVDIDGATNFEIWEGDSKVRRINVKVDLTPTNNNYRK